MGKRSAKANPKQEPREYPDSATPQQKQHIDMLRDAAPPDVRAVQGAPIVMPAQPIEEVLANVGVIIAIPCYGTMATRTALCLAMTARMLHGLKDIRMTTGTYLHYNRELLLNQALDTEGATHLMFIDTDLIFPVDGVARLLAHDKAIVGANYNQRSQAQLLDRGSLTSTVKPFGHDIKPMDVEEGLFKVRAIATGFMLINLDAVRDMPRPWFFFGEEDDGTLVGEDIWFCDRAREYGLDVWCDSTIKVGHIGEWVF